MSRVGHRNAGTIQPGWVGIGWLAFAVLGLGHFRGIAVSARRASGVRRTVTAALGGPQRAAQATERREYD